MKQITALWLIVALTAAATVLLLYRIESVQAHQNDALRAIMCHAEHVVKTQPGLTAKQRREALHFYSSSLADAHLAPCN